MVAWGNRGIRRKMHGEAWLGSVVVLLWKCSLEARLGSVVVILVRSLVQRIVVLRFGGPGLRHEFWRSASNCEKRKNLGFLFFSKRRRWSANDGSDGTCKQGASEWEPLACGDSGHSFGGWVSFSYG